MEVRMSWFGMVAVAALLFVVVSGLINPRTRPFVLGMIALVGIGLVLAFFVATPLVHVQESQRQEVRPRSVVTDQVVAQRISPPPVPAPPKSAAANEAKRPKMTVIAALRQAIVQSWTGHGPAPVAEAPEKPEVGGQKPEVGGQKPEVVQPGPPMAPPKPKPPAWVNAAPQLQDGCYTMSVPVGPFMNPLECERELPKELREAVVKYAELSLDREAAAVRLPDDVLRQLVQDRWTEIRPMEIDGGSQDMVLLHAKVVFDADMQQRIKTEAQRLVIGKRVRGGAVVFGGVLGLLALAWGGLRYAARRQQATT